MTTEVLGLATALNRPAVVLDLELHRLARERLARSGADARFTRLRTLTERVLGAG